MAPIQDRYGCRLLFAPWLRRDLCPTGEEGFLYPARFEYTAPTTLEEVIATLSERGDEAKVLAGGRFDADAVGRPAAPYRPDPSWWANAIG